MLNKIAKKKQPIKLELTTIEFRITNEGIRIWNTQWFGDQFEIISNEEFLKVKSVMARFSIPVIETED